MNCLTKSTGIGINRTNFLSEKNGAQKQIHSSTFSKVFRVTLKRDINVKFDLGEGEVEG